MGFYKSPFEQQRDGVFYPYGIFQAEIFFEDMIEVDDRPWLQPKFVCNPFDVVIEAESYLDGMFRCENFRDGRFADPAERLENIGAMPRRELQDMRPFGFFTFPERGARFRVESDEGIMQKIVEGRCGLMRCRDEVYVFGAKPGEGCHAAGGSGREVQGCL